jgi:exopolyphosphatase/guanosine-5'-triphosphate,3'-diphosphate pyrophosphatase
MSEADAGRPLAVIDIGSNSVRLVIYERPARAPIALHNEKSLCGLGRGLAATGLLAPEAVTCALHAVRRFYLVARAMRAATIDVVATEAVRRAANGAEFLVQAGKACGGAVAVLSGDEEARTAAMGVAYSTYEPDGFSGDLGGGSIDLAQVGPDGPGPPYASLPLGTLPVAEALADGLPAALRLIEDRLLSVPWLRGAAAGRRFYVVGGGWRALGRVRLALTDNPLKIVHDYAVTGEEALRLARSIVALEPGELATLPGLPGRRAETVPAAALLLEHLVARLEPAELVFSAFGLREGRLFMQLPAEELARDPLLAGAEDFGRSRSHTPDTGTAMGAWTAGLFAAETPAQRRIRLAACILSDTAWREHPGARALEAFFRLVQYPFIGLGHTDRVLIAYTVFTRYEGSPHEPFLRPFLALLSEPERRRAEVLGTALQLGYRLSAGLPALLEGHRLLVGDGELRLRLAISQTAPDEASLRARLRALARALGMERFAVESV